VQGTTRAPQVESVGDACSEESKIIAEAEVKRAYRFNQVSLRHQVVDKVSVRSRSGEQATSLA